MPRKPLDGVERHTCPRGKRAAVSLCHTASAGVGAEKVLVNGAREKVVEMEGLSREMGEWSLLDEAGDMRGARRELDGHEAPARPLDNQVL